MHYIIIAAHALSSMAADLTHFFPSLPLSRSAVSFLSYFIRVHFYQKFAFFVFILFARANKFFRRNDAKPVKCTERTMTKAIFKNIPSSVLAHSLILFGSDPLPGTNHAQPEFR